MARNMPSTIAGASPASPRRRRPPDIKAVYALVADDFAAVNALIPRRLTSDVGLVEEIGRHIIDSGGKRLRPLLVLLERAMPRLQRRRAHQARRDHRIPAHRDAAARRRRRSVRSAPRSRHCQPSLGQCTERSRRRLSLLARVPVDGRARPHRHHFDSVRRDQRHRRRRSPATRQRRQRRSQRSELLRRHPRKDRDAVSGRLAHRGGARESRRERRSTPSATTGSRWVSRINSSTTGSTTQAIRR